MRMNLAIGSPVNRFLALLLAHPERFQRSEVPCCLQGIWEAEYEVHQAGPPETPPIGTDSQHSASGRCIRPA